MNTIGQIPHKILTSLAQNIAVIPKKEQDRFQQLIAKISLALHNFFTSSNHNINLNDQESNNIATAITKDCHEILLQYKASPYDLNWQNYSKIITVENQNPNIEIRAEISNNNLRIIFSEKSEAFWFEQTEELILKNDKLTFIVLSI